VGVLQYNVTYPVKWTKEGKEGTRWPIVGRAFEGKQGSITIQLDAIPLNFTGKLMLFLIDEDKPGAKASLLSQGSPPSDGDVPF
jgi:hypothetical protein